MPRHPRRRRRVFRPQGASTAPSAEVASPPPVATVADLHVWQPPQVVKVTTQMTVEHRQLMAYLEATTGKRMWELLGEAIEQTYGPATAHSALPDQHK